MKKILLFGTAIACLSGFAGTARAGSLTIGQNPVLGSSISSPITCPDNTTPGSCISAPQAESGLVVNPFPLGTTGYTDGAKLTATTSGLYTFTYKGVANPTQHNSFTVSTVADGTLVSGTNLFSENGPPWDSSNGSSTVGDQFTIRYNAGDAIDFIFNSTGGAGTCSISAGTVGGTGATSATPCSYLLAVDGSASTTSPLTSGNAVWIGFSDVTEGRDQFGGNGVLIGADYQDFVVEVTVPEPASMALLGVGLAAIGVTRRRFRG